MCLLAACLTWAAPCRADFRYTPAIDGTLGAWLVAGPLAPNAAQPERATPITGTARAPQYWRAAASETGTLDLKRALGTAIGDRRVALVGAVLELAEPLEGWLLFAADGPIAVWVDGQLLTEQSGGTASGYVWDGAPVDLAPGVHRLVLQLQQVGQDWQFRCRLLTRSQLRAPKGIVATLPGVSDDQASRISDELLHADLRATFDDGALRPSLTLSFPAGAPLAPGRASVEWLPGGERRILGGIGGQAVQQVPGDATPRHPLTVTLPAVSPAAGAAQLRQHTLRVTLGGTQRELPVWLSEGLLNSARRAQEHLQTAPPLLATSIRYALQELETLVALGPSYRVRLAQQALDDVVSLAEKKEDPLAVPGVHALALTSSLDGRAQPFEIHVPHQLESGRLYPATILLHGYNGSPRGIMSAFLGTEQRSAHPKLEGFVVAPNAHGNAFYRGPGEAAVIELSDWMLKTLPIDPARISISGVSMGGTGSAAIALRYPERFSAAAPLCGYQSFFHRRDTQGTRQPWEVSQMHHWSPASWAANGHALPLYIAHGLKDPPLENSKVLVRAYSEAGNPVEQEWPDTDHSVWKISYRGARLWPWLSRHVRPDPSFNLKLHTDSLRYGRRQWLEITEFIKSGEFASLEATLRNDTLKIVSRNVQALRLHSASFPQPVPPRVEINSHPLAPGNYDNELVLTAEGNFLPRPGNEPSPRKLATNDGAIYDFFLDPVMFVYGTLDPRTTRANREVAERFGRLYPGFDAHYAVLRDRDVWNQPPDGRNLVLVGNGDDHLLLRAWATQLPIVAAGGRLTWAGQTQERPGLGATFVFPDPRQPRRPLLVITAPDPLGIWRALSLPRLLPEFMIYDDGVRAAAHQQILGRASVVAAGYFDALWRMPLTASN